VKQLQLDTVRPTVEEVQTFANYINTFKKEGEDTSGDEGLTGEELIKRTFLEGN
jgi:hypothetical protein